MFGYFLNLLLWKLSLQCHCLPRLSQCNVFNHPPARLASRSSIWSSDVTPVDINAQWREVWTSAPVVNQSLVPDPTIRQPGFDLPRHTWSMLNRFWTGRGTCRADLHQWGLSTSESCSCGQKQTMSHIVDSCPLSRFEGGLQQLHTADDRAFHWLETAAKKALAKRNETAVWTMWPLV